MLIGLLPGLFDYLCCREAPIPQRQMKEAPFEGEEKRREWGRLVWTQASLCCFFPCAILRTSFSEPQIEGHAITLAEDRPAGCTDLNPDVTRLLRWSGSPSALQGLCPHKGTLALAALLAVIPV